jgi:hypothetical protein
MIVVLASQHDAIARGLVDRWSDGGGSDRRAALLSCEDLTTTGWKWDASSPSSSVAVVAGQRIPCGAIQGVLMRRPCVLQEELIRIEASDRAYVAAEINAFLMAWLYSLSCPMLNRPTATCLSGPNWRPEQWVSAAAALGIPAKERRRSVPFTPSGSEEPDAEEIARLVVVGQHVLGDADAGCAADARKLAAAAGVDLMEVRFAGREMRCASCWPDLCDPTLVHAVHAYFDGGRGTA